MSNRRTFWRDLYALDAEIEDLARIDSREVYSDPLEDLPTQDELVSGEEWEAIERDRASRRPRFVPDPSSDDLILF